MRVSSTPLGKQILDETEVTQSGAEYQQAAGRAAFVPRLFCSRTMQ